jgi:thiamine-monophosphate kinase
LKVADTGEFGLIEILRRKLGEQDDDLICGVGDDTAVFRSRQGGLWAYTADAVVESVHFDTAYVAWHALGYKSLAANISDLAAMGGSAPSFALVVLGLTGDIEVEAVEEIYRGMRDCGQEFSCRVVGGDIVRSPQHMFVSVSLVGLLAGERFLTRGGARPGQVVMVTGTLGDSYLGLKWLMGGRDDSNPCAQRHLYPQPRLEEGRRALESGAAACIDVSDGLLRDLGHVCEESGVGAEVFLQDIPISAAAWETGRELGEDSAGAALFGGEDYELILVADEDKAAGLRGELGLAAIGRITDGGGVVVLDPSGKKADIGRIGYEHFKEG